MADVPSREECKVILENHKARATVYETITETLASIGTIVKTFTDLKWGMLGTLAGDLYAAVGAVASKMAQNLLGSVSSMASAFMEQFLSKFLAILLAAPTAIFSIVAIPLEQANIAADEERIALNKARGNLRNIVNMLRKWFGGAGFGDYLAQMKEALPFINSAINNANALLSGLQADNAFFNERIYNALKNDLDQAISITTPTSVIEEELQINKQLEAKRHKKLASLTAEINTEYNERRRGITKKYQDRMGRLGNWGGGDESDSLGERNKDRLSNNDLALATERKRIQNTYNQDQSDLDSWKKIEVSKAEIKSNEIAFGDLDYSFKSKRLELDMDVSRLLKELKSFVKNIATAYGRNKECQIYTNNVFNINGLIKEMISWCLAILRKADGAGLATVLPGVLGANALIKAAKKKFEANIKRAREGKAYAAELATGLTYGNISLLSADALLEASITRSMIDLLNSDETLAAADKEFDRFLGRLKGIQDWDGKSGIWAVSFAKSTATTPYLQLIADATTLLATVPALAFSNTEESQKKLKKLTSNVNKVFTKIDSHNAQVKNVLTSYTPYQGSDIGDLKEILAMAGMLQTFALGMSLLEIGKLAIAMDTRFGDSDADYANCKEEYPGDFDFTDEDLQQSVEAYEMQSRQNFPAKELYNESQVDAEKSQLKLAKVRAMNAFYKFEDKE